MRNNPKCQKCFGTGRVFMAGGSTQQCDCFITNPAPKEEEMEIDMQLSDHLLTAEELAHNEHIDRKRAKKHRALAREAYMAALGGLSSIDALADDGIVQHATTIAIETVRRWDAFMAAVDAEGGE